MKPTHMDEDGFFSLSLPNQTLTSFRNTLTGTRNSVPSAIQTSLGPVKLQIMYKIKPSSPPLDQTSHKTTASYHSNSGLFIIVPL